MSNNVSLSVIIPAFNEELSIEEAVITNLHSLEKAQIDFEIIIIDDGSTDRTKQIIEEKFSDTRNIKLHSKENGGFGSAVKKGIELAEKEYVMYAPADNPMDENLLSSFLQNIGKADILVSYRVKREGYSLRMRMNSSIYHVLISYLFRLSLKDYNWMHLYRREIFQKIHIENEYIFMLAEIHIKARDLGFEVLEFPVTMRAREKGRKTAASLTAAIRTFRDLFGFYFRYKFKKRT